MHLPHKICLLFKALRISEWRGYVGLSLFGLALSSGDLQSFTLGLFRLLPLVFFYMSTAYLTNNIFDAEGDRLNPHKAGRNPFAQNLLRPEEGLAALLLIVLSSLVFAVRLYGSEGFLVYAAALVIVIFYSAPPLRFKEKPPFDLLSHSLFFGVLPLLIGYYAGEGRATLNPLLMLAIAIYSIQLELRNEIEDFTADMLASYRTTAVLFGYRESYAFAWGTTAVFIALTAYMLCELGLGLLGLFPISLALLAFLEKVDFRIRMKIVDLYATFFLAIFLFMSC